MKGMKINSASRALALALLLLVVSGCCAGSLDVASGEGFAQKSFPLPQVPFAPRHYICQRTAEPLAIDGRLDEAAWQLAPWTANFVDIEGDLKPAPRLRTRARMLWDDQYFYVAAHLEEPHVFATLTERDCVIFQDNDFEVFIDPDGDTHEYYELELNALNTQWDLMLVKPYRDDGAALNAWDIQGLKTAVHVDGTLNDPGDQDRAWTVEIAFPWAVLAQAAHRPTPPRDGDQWRVNFSRVEWRTKIVDGGYVKEIDPATDKPFPENNWIWSAQGLIAMHYPEMWGIVQFADRVAGSATVAYVPDPELEPAWFLRRVYYAERSFHGREGRFFTRLDECPEDLSSLAQRHGEPDIRVTASGFEAVVSIANGVALHIDESGRQWRTPGKFVGE